MVAGLVITITMAHDGGWSCEPVVVAMHTNDQRHYILTAILNIFRIVNFLQQNEFRCSKTVLGNSF